LGGTEKGTAKAKSNRGKLTRNWRKLRQEESEEKRVGKTNSVMRKGSA